MKRKLEYALKVGLRKLWGRIVPVDEMKAIFAQDYEPCVMVDGPVTYNKDRLTTTLNAGFQYEE